MQVLGVRKVALLFLTDLPELLPHDQLWRYWLESAAGLLPQQILVGLQDAACGPVREKWLLLLCACYPKRVAGVAAAVQPPWQYLFSIFVHTPPWGEEGYQGARCRPRQAGLSTSCGCGRPPVPPPAHRCTCCRPDMQACLTACSRATTSRTVS